MSVIRTGPLTIVRNQLQTALELVAWIERARSKTLPDDHFLSVDMTVETVRYLSNLVNSFSDNPEVDELEAEQHINRQLTRTIIEVQGERDRYRAALKAASALADWVGWWLSARREAEASKFTEMRARLDAYRAARRHAARRRTGRGGG